MPPLLLYTVVVVAVPFFLFFVIVVVNFALFLSMSLVFVCVGGYCDVDAILLSLALFYFFITGCPICYLLYLCPILLILLLLLILST